MATVHFQGRCDRRRQWLALTPLSKKVPGFESPPPPPPPGLFYVNPRGFSPVAPGSFYKPRHAFGGGGEVKRPEHKRERDWSLAFPHWPWNEPTCLGLWASAPSSGEPAHGEEVETKRMGRWEVENAPPSVLLCLLLPAVWSHSHSSVETWKRSADAAAPAAQSHVWVRRLSTEHSRQTHRLFEGKRVVSWRVFPSCRL